MTMSCSGARLGLLQSSGERRSQCLHPLIKVCHRALLLPVYMVQGMERGAAAEDMGRRAASSALPWAGAAAALECSLWLLSALAPRSLKDTFWTHEPTLVLHRPPLPAVSAHEAPSHLPIAFHPPPALLLQRKPPPSPGPRVQPLSIEEQKVTQPGCHLCRLHVPHHQPDLETLPRLVRRSPGMLQAHPSVFSRAAE